MVIQYVNIQPLQTRSITKYPFSKQSTLLLDNITLDPTQILSCNIQVQDALFPLFIGAVEEIEDAILLTIKDISLTKIAYLQLSDKKNFFVFKDTASRVCGSMRLSQNSNLYHTFKAFVSQTSKRDINSQAFQLSAQCITCVHYSGIQRIFFNGKEKSGVIEINACNNACFQKSYETQISINVYGDLDISYISIPKIKNIIIQEGDNIKQQFDYTTQNVVFKPTALSDLRVVTTQKHITFKGVKDVT